MPFFSPTETVMMTVCHTIHKSIEALMMTRERVIVGIDGRCASGKTTLAAALAEALGCPVIHMDHFFLRPHMRTPERLSQPGGNVDKERFYEEVMIPLKADLPFSYRPFDCQTGALADPVGVPFHRICIVEGTYSLCPELWEHYDLRVCLTVDPEVQLSRIEKRNGAQMKEIFRTRWIPMEEAYFKAFHIEARSDLHFDMTEL